MKQFLRRSLARAVAAVPPGILSDKAHADIFQRRGLHIIPDHFYEPIPNTDNIDRSIWDKPSDLVGINENVPAQIALFEEVAGFLDVHAKLSVANEGGFTGIDGAMLYAIVRKIKPNRIIEIGAGHSTLISIEAMNANGKGQITAIDPYPRPYLVGRNDITLIKSEVERLPLSTFELLQSGDILFIDSSHVIRIGGDVLYEVLDILPRLKPGVLVHIHDIFLPEHYPKEWTLKRRVFWTEQYLVQAFLAFNSAFEIVWSSGIMQTRHRELIRPRFGDGWGSSLWLQRVR